MKWRTEPRPSSSTAFDSFLGSSSRKKLDHKALLHQLTPPRGGTPPAPPAEEAQCCPDQLGGVGVDSREEEAAHSASKWVSLKACFLLPSPIQASSCPTSPKTSLSLQGGLGKNKGHHLFSYSSASLHTQHRLLPQPSETPLGHTGSDLPLNYSLPGCVLFNCTGLQPINHCSPTCKHFCESLIV